MSRFTYRPQVEKELARGNRMVAVVETFVTRGADFARDAAPKHTHHYERSIGSTVGVDTSGVVGSVYASDPFAHIVEFGSVNNPPYAPLRRGIERTGLRVTDRHARSR